MKKIKQMGYTGISGTARHQCSVRGIPPFRKGTLGECRSLYIYANSGTITTLRDGKDPDRAAFRHLRELSWKEPVKGILVAARIPSPARFDSYILPSVDQK